MGIVEDYAREHGLLQENDEAVIADWVAKAIEENPKAIEDLKSGEVKTIDFLVGRVMRLSGGVANPSVARELLEKFIT